MTIENSVDKKSIWSAFGQLLRQELLPVLTDLRLAIVMLLIIAIFSVTGTVIEQGQAIAFYQANYPEHPALFGFLTWKVLLTLGLDHVYRTWWFLALLIFFGTSLTACTFTRQLPALKAARRWKFYDEPRQFQKLALSAEFDVETLHATSVQTPATSVQTPATSVQTPATSVQTPATSVQTPATSVQTPATSVQTLTQLLQNRRYKVFQEKDDTVYARKGLIGRMGPIVVHVGIVTILLGSIWGAMTGFVAQEMVTSGDTFQVKNLIDAGPWATALPKDWSVRVNRFWIDYTSSGGIDQFYSDMSVLNDQEQEVDRKTIFVNSPLRYRGVTLYQTDWGISAVRVRVNKSPIFQLPMAQLNTNGKGRIWGTWIPTKPDLSEGVSLLAKDLQGTVLIYDATGKLVDTVRAGMSTSVNGVTLKILDVLGSTGLQIKADPGIPIVYTGFALLMLGVVMSYFSHSQIWVLQKDGRLYVGGKTNRAQVTFEREMLEILDKLSLPTLGEEKAVA